MVRIGRLSSRPTRRSSCAALLSAFAVWSCGGVGREGETDNATRLSGEQALSAPDFGVDISAHVQNPREGRFVGSRNHILILDRHAPYLRLLTRDGELLWSGGASAPVSSSKPEAIGVAGDKVLVVERGTLALWHFSGDSLALEELHPLDSRYLPLGAAEGCLPGWLVYVRDDESDPPPGFRTASRDAVTIRVLPPSPRSHDLVTLWALPIAPGATAAEGHAGTLIARRDMTVTLLHRASPREAGVILEADCDGTVRRQHRELALVTGDSLPVLVPRPRPLEWTAGIVGIGDGFIIAQQRWFSPVVHGVDSYHYSTELLRFSHGEYVGSIIIRGQWKLLDYDAGLGVLLAMTEPSPHFAVLSDTVFASHRLLMAADQ